MDEKARKAAYRARQLEKGLASTTVWVPAGTQHVIHLMAGSLQIRMPFSWSPTHPDTIIPLQATITAPAAPEAAVTPPEPEEAKVIPPWAGYVLLAVLAVAGTIGAGAVAHLIKTRF